MPKKKLAQPRIFFGILEFHLSLEFTLAFNQEERSTPERQENAVWKGINKSYLYFFLYKAMLLLIKRKSRKTGGI